MSTEEVQWREVFDACDTDKSGSVSCGEMCNMLQQLGYSKEEAEKSARVGDIHHSTSGKYCHEAY